jgi:hypothetical protein
VGPALQDFGIRNFASSGVQTLTYTNFQNARKEKVGPAFWDFRVQGFVVFIAKQQNTTIPEIAKRKECGTNISGFRGSESHDFKSQKTSTTNNS